MGWVTLEFRRTFPESDPRAPHHVSTDCDFDHVVLVVALAQMQHALAHSDVAEYCCSLGGRSKVGTAAAVEAGQRSGMLFRVECDTNMADVRT